MKAVTRSQALALMRRFSLIDFKAIDHDCVDAVLQMSEKEFVRRATAFIANGCPYVAKSQLSREAHGRSKGYIDDLGHWIDEYGDRRGGI